MTRSGCILLGIALPGLLALPELRNVLEADMVGHMLVQFPLLIAAGLCLGQGLPHGWGDNWNKHGITGLVMALCVSSFWMIPLALDQVLVQPWLEAAKFLSLPLGVGTALALSWRRAGLIAKGFFLGNVLPMLAVVGWLYLESPMRLCNAYLTSQQENAGSALIWVAVIGMLAWLSGFFIRPGSSDSRLIPSPQNHEKDSIAFRLDSPI